MKLHHPLLVFALFASFALTARADFIPGRVRPHYRSAMTAVASAGAFEGVREALVTLNYEDGNPTPVSFSVYYPGQTKALILKIHGLERTGCGDRYEATQIDAANTSLVLDDFSHSACDRALQGLWDISLERRDGHDSKLRLEGNPQGVIVTM